MGSYRKQSSYRIDITFRFVVNFILTGEGAVECGSESGDFSMKKFLTDPRERKSLEELRTVVSSVSFNRISSFSLGEVIIVT